MSNRPVPREVRPAHDVARSCARWGTVTLGSGARDTSELARFGEVRPMDARDRWHRVSVPRSRTPRHSRYVACMPLIRA